MNHLKLHLYAIISLCVLSPVALAQEKLWTWKVPPGEFTHVLHAVAMASDGSAAFVLGQSTVGTSADVKASSYLLVWVDKNGKIIMSRNLPTGDSNWLIFSGQGGWEIGLFGDSKLAVANKKTVRIYTLEGDKVSGPTILEQKKAMMFGGNGFQGWLERDSVLKRVDVRNRYTGNNSLEFQNIKSLTAWRL